MGKKVLGTAEFGAFMHRNNGGKINISSYTATNKPLKVDAADETECIARRKFLIVEDERPELDGNKFYSKDVWNEQTESGKKDYSDKNPSSTKEYYEDSQTQNKPVDNNEIPAWGKVLKNFVDKIKDENNTQWILIAIIGIVAGIALGLAAL